MAVVTTNLGTVTAYGDAVAAGYTGTKAQWQALMADYATVGQQAAQSAQTASTAATTATTAASTATTKASEASASATAAAATAQTRYGSPLVAQTAEEMVEQNRVYVYVGSESGYSNGHWYYHNGTEWVDGGVYNGSAVNTDTTLTQSGMAADAKAVGDELSTIKEDLSDLHNVVMGSDAFENGAFGSSSGKADNAYRIRLKNPVYVEKGTEIYLSIGTLYSMIWEMSTNATTGGNIIASKAWGAEIKYTVKNDSWIMISFSKTASGATREITVDEFDGFVFVNRINSNTMYMYPSAVNVGTYSSLLPTLESAAKNTIYRFVSLPTMMDENGGTWVNCPIEMRTRQTVGQLATYGAGNTTASMQVLTLQSGKRYVRYVNEVSGNKVWTSWQLDGFESITIAADGSGDYTSFVKGLAEAVKTPNSYVYVKEGTYDIIAEYKALYGDSFFENYTSTSDQGPILCNGVTVEFAPNAYLVCDYTGNNSAVQNRFSPLNSGTASNIGGKGFTLINCHLTDHNVRYSMHDERNFNTDYYHNRYIGCHFIHDKGNGSGYVQALGGGLGQNGLIEIDNCIFESVTSTDAIVSWHNCKNAGSRSQIFIRNSMVKGKVRFSYYGESTLISTMIVTGCKMYAEPIKTQEASSYTTDNVEILAWGNTIERF